MSEFDHERLDVYRTAIEFVVIANDIAEQLPRGRGYLADQLQRAATSIPLNIGEGAGEFSSGEKARFYSVPGGAVRRRSAPRSSMSAGDSDSSLTTRSPRRASC